MHSDSADEFAIAMFPGGPEMCCSQWFFPSQGSRDYPWLSEPWFLGGAFGGTSNADEPQSGFNEQSGLHDGGLHCDTHMEHRVRCNLL